MNENQEKKLCPVFVCLVAHDEFVQINPDAALHMARCHESECAWYNNFYQTCALTAMSLKF